MKRFVGFLCLSVLASLWLNSQSVEHVRNIQIKYKGGMNQSVKSFLFGKKKGEQVKPYALCRLSPDRMCVTDAVNGAVYIIDAGGIIKKKITRVKGIRLVSPVGVCTDDCKNLYISDSTRGGIIRFNPGYKFERVFAAPTDSRITGIVFSKAVLYGVDTQNHRVLCFDREGALKFTFGKRGTGNGEFNFPTHIYANNDFIYITDAMNFRVQIFDHTGAFVRVLGSWGRGGGNFSKPKGVAVDKKNRVFVTDAMFDNVQIFNREGTFLYFFGVPGQQDGEFWMPMGIMVNRDNTIWVADTYNNRLQVFKLLEDAS
ncbi:MAG: 6-bladed beta-propeller [bacterium]|nr:6-bladed beta-propeller [bacterium]